MTNQIGKLISHIVSQIETEEDTDINAQDNENEKIEISEIRKNSEKKSQKKYSNDIDLGVLRQQIEELQREKELFKEQTEHQMTYQDSLERSYGLKNDSENIQETAPDSFNFKNLQSSYSPDTPKGTYNHNTYNEDPQELLFKVPSSDNENENSFEVPIESFSDNENDFFGQGKNHKNNITYGKGQEEDEGLEHIFEYKI